MQLKTHKTSKTLNTMPVKTCLAVSGMLCLAGSLGLVYHFANASAAEYSLTDNEVILNGTDDGTAYVSLNTSVAHTYVAVEGTWSLHEVVESGAEQTEYLSLSGMTRGGSIAASFGTNGKTAWTPDPGADGMAVAAGGSVLTAAYTVDKDTPEGEYKISFSGGTFTYHDGSSDVDEADTIAEDVTITVVRDEGDDVYPEADSDDEEEATDDSEDGAEAGGITVPNTGKMTNDGGSAGVVTISIASIIAALVLFTATIAHVKNHKEINFSK